MQLALALSVAIVAWPRRVAGAPCTALTQNILTSKRCPAACGSSPCVLYASSQAAQCQADSLAGPCRTETGYLVDGASEGCDLSYQCLTKLLDDGSHEWAVVVGGKVEGNLTTVSVTEISGLSYPSTATGVAITSQRSGIASVDSSVFSTPPSVIDFQLTGVLLPDKVTGMDFADRKWERATFSDVALDRVPDGFRNLSLSYMDMSRNKIQSIADNETFVATTTLLLQYNNLSTIEASLPLVEILNLSGNPIEAVSFFRTLHTMVSLRTLSLRACNLADVRLNHRQLEFLEDLDVLEANFTVTRCPVGWTASQLLSTNGTVCVEAPQSAPTIPPTSARKQKSSANVYLAVAVALVVALGAVLVVALRRRRQGLKPSQQTVEYEVDSFDQSPDPRSAGEGFYGFQAESSTYGTSSIWSDPGLQALRLEATLLSVTTLVSESHYGQVWAGQYAGELVAVKRLASKHRSLDRAMALALGSKRAALLEHPRIARLIGIKMPRALEIQSVSEFLGGGNVRSLLAASDKAVLTWEDCKCQWVIDVADALAYMHSRRPCLTYRDLTSRTVLLDGSQTRAKLSAFALARDDSAASSSSSFKARWSAPEALRGENITERADVYSLGVLLWELHSHQLPYEDATNPNGSRMTNAKIALSVMKGSLRLDFAEEYPADIGELAMECLSVDPAMRPSAMSVSYRVRDILKNGLYP